MKRSSLFPLCLLCALTALPALAQKAPTTTLEAEVSHQPGSSLSFAAPGEKLSLTEAETRLSHSRPLNEGLLRFGGYYGYSSYDYSRTTADLKVDSLGISLFSAHPIDSQWSWYGTTGASWAADRQARLSAGGVYFVSGGVTYKFTEDFRLSAGITVKSRLQDSTAILPTPGIDWQISDKLRLYTANGAFLTYDYFGDKSTVLDAGVRYSSRDLRLESTPAAGRRALRDTAWALDMGATYTFANSWFVRPGLSVILERDLETRTQRAGNSKMEQDTALSLSLSGGYRF